MIIIITIILWIKSDLLACLELTTYKNKQVYLKSKAFQKSIKIPPVMESVTKLCKPVFEQFSLQTN